jgi:hypothetical protein
MGQEGLDTFVQKKYRVLKSQDPQQFPKILDWERENYCEHCSETPAKG